MPKMHAPSELALNKIINQTDLNIVGIVRSDISLLSSRYWSYIAYGIRRSGLYYGAMIGLVAYLHVFGLFLGNLFFWWRRRQWLTSDEIIGKFNLASLDTSDINSEDSIKTLRAWDPDILVSICFDQILKKEVIEISRIALNMHPGLLPKYRGIWPEFWNLYRGDKKAGITIHHINEEIDAGDIVDRFSFPIEKEDSKFGLTLKTAYFGAKRLISVLKNLKRGEHLPALQQDSDSPEYRSLPRKKHFATFFAQGKKLVNWVRDLLKIARLSRDIDSIH